MCLFLIFFNRKKRRTRSPISPATPAIDPPTIAPTGVLCAAAMVSDGVADVVFDADAADAVFGVVVVALLVVMDTKEVREEEEAVVLFEELVDDTSTADNDDEVFQQSYWHPLLGKQLE